MSAAVTANSELSLFTRLKSRLLDLSPREASFARRGFPGVNSPSRAHLEQVIETFIEGYNLSVTERDMVQLTKRLDASFSPAFVGFAYEGTGLYFALADLFFPRAESRLATFTRTVARPFDFITMVGAGFAVARVPFGLRRLESYQQNLNRLTSWCLADGYGFHQGFFYWQRFVEGGEAPPPSLDLQNRRLFDAGVGRAMWWVFGADPSAIAKTISKVDAERRPEMWMGIGTALAYAGGAPPDALASLPSLAGEYRLDLLSGIPFAAHMRDRGRNPAEWTDEVCATLLGRSVADTSKMIFGELNDYLESWQGSEEAKWSGCYLALRERVKRRLQN
jgi:enediyne biosynthesis protein E3